MTRYGNLLEAIAKDLSIKQGDTESTASYASRLIYSAVGRLMLASLHDRIERNPGEEDMVSVKHLTDKGKDILRAYIKMYPHYLSIEDVDLLNDLLNSNDTNSLELGLKMLVGYNVSEYPVTTRLLLYNNNLTDTKA